MHEPVVEQQRHPDPAGEQVHHRDPDGGRHRAEHHGPEAGAEVQEQEERARGDADLGGPDHLDRDGLEHAHHRPVGQPQQGAGHEHARRLPPQRQHRVGDGHAREDRVDDGVVPVPVVQHAQDGAAHDGARGEEQEEQARHHRRVALLLRERGHEREDAAVHEPGGQGHARRRRHLRGEHVRPVQPEPARQRRLGHAQEQGDQQGHAREADARPEQGVVAEGRAQLQGHHRPDGARERHGRGEPAGALGAAHGRDDPLHGRGQHGAGRAEAHAVEQAYRGQCGQGVRPEVRRRREDVAGQGDEQDPPPPPREGGGRRRHAGEDRAQHERPHHDAGLRVRRAEGRDGVERHGGHERVEDHRHEQVGGADEDERARPQRRARGRRRAGGVGGRWGGGHDLYVPPRHEAPARS